MYSGMRSRRSLPVGTTCIEPNQSCTVYIHSILRDGENKLFKYLLCVRGVGVGDGNWEWEMGMGKWEWEWEIESTPSPRR